MTPTARSETAPPRRVLAPPRGSVSRRVEPVLLILVFALLAAGLASLSTSREAVESERWVGHSIAVRGALTDLLLAATGYESAARGYVVTGDPRHLEAYADAPERCRARLEELRALTSEDAVQRARLDRLAPALEEKLAWVTSVVRVRRTAGVEASAGLVKSDTGRQLMNQVRAVVAEMTDEETRKLAGRAAAHAAAAKRSRRLVAIATALEVLIVAGVVLLIRRDVTGRRAAEDALREMATVDPLTGLLNRRGFLDRGPELVALAERFGRRAALFFADLDGLKGINDAFGHPAGDEALEAAARAFRGTFRSSDVVARWSGDEFVALTAVEKDGDEEEILARLAAGTREVNASAGLPFVISLSVGAISASGTAESIPDLVARADRAMYEQKGRRRGASALPS